MTGIPPIPAPDDPLDIAADALRRASVPEGPQAETIARILAALRAAADAKTVPFYRRKFMRYAFKMAAVVLVAVGVAVYFTGILPLRSPLAFAEVAAKLRDARTLTYEITHTDPQQKELATIKVFYKEPGLIRNEGGGQVAITDLQKRKILLRDPVNKTAVLVDYYETPENAKKAPASLIDELRKLADKKGESIGKKQVGDIEAVGFRVETEGLPLTVWADPKSRMPVLIEMSLSVGERVVGNTLSDFQLDPKLEDDLFSLEPPEGYKLQKIEVKDAKPEDDVAYLLRAYAKKYDGKFPRSLSMASEDWQTYLEQRWGDKKPQGLSDPEFVQFLQRVTRVEVLQLSKKDHGYKPDGVKLGDRDKIIFWYRPDRTDKYRAVYGDLHTADVKADQLPDKPKK
jgi:outer membrane lipoprotein-sorting protein